MVTTFVWQQESSDRDWLDWELNKQYRSVWVMNNKGMGTSQNIGKYGYQNFMNTSRQTITYFLNNNNWINITRCQQRWSNWILRIWVYAIRSTIWGCYKERRYARTRIVECLLLCLRLLITLMRCNLVMCCQFTLITILSMWVTWWNTSTLVSTMCTLWIYIIKMRILYKTINNK